MMEAIKSIVHGNEKPKQAYKIYEDIKNS